MVHGQKPWKYHCVMCKNGTNLVFFLLLLLLLLFIHRQWESISVEFGKYMPYNSTQDWLFFHVQTGSNPINTTSAFSTASSNSPGAHVPFVSLCVMDDLSFGLYWSEL